MNLAIIPARGGSTRIPRKNIRPFHGKPIIAYSIETARASRLFDEIVVSTDDQDIVAVAKAYGAKVHMRPARYCENNVGTQEVARVVINWWNICHPEKKADLACCIYATAPLMLPEDLLKGYALLNSTGANYVYTTGGSPISDAGQWYWGKASAFIDRVPLDREWTRLHLPEHRVCDINTEDDWQRAQLLFAQLQQAKRVSDYVDNQAIGEIQGERAK